MPKKTRRAKLKPKHEPAPPLSPAPSNAEPGQADSTLFPIVGVGGSAGGYEAFVQLLQALPADTGMAFVFIMHLEPEHKSMLAKLLANVTPMPVTEARNGQTVERNHVYVIPPKADIAIREGVLEIVVRRKFEGRYLPFDKFLSSLAHDRHGRAIAVILSGTGSDGTMGCQAVKEAGGITFAQDEESAKHYGMPGSAIATDCIDFVMPADRIGQELQRLARHPYVGLPQAPKQTEQLPLVGENEFSRVLYLLRSTSGVDFMQYKAGTIRRRIARRMALLKIETLKKYLAYLHSSRDELQALFQDILIHVTSFFREPEAFKLLQSRVFPQIVANKKPGEPIRIWVPGCSTGEEVYSLAIGLLEFLGDRASSTPIQAFGTDISESAIEKARSGTYSESSMQEVSAVRQRRFFTKTEGGYRVSKTLREMCIFARQDLTKDPPFSRIDLISCRNVLIYMGSTLQKRVIASFHYALREGGFLLVGKSEALTTHADLFVLADRKGHVYSKKASATRAAAPEFSTIGYEKIPHMLPAHEEPVFDALKEADRLMWQRFSHAGLVLNDNLDILHFRGDTARYVAPSSGKASLNALRIVKDELKTELRSLIHRARRTNGTVRATGVRLKHNGSARDINLEVEPLTRPGSRERYFLVLFDDPHKTAELPLPAERAPKTRRASHEQNREMEQMQRELDAAREYAQSVVEQQEASSEELKSANEEILSSNEELQSTNEELETAKEELQSTNEELVTLNETMQNRNTELAKLTDDLTNVLDGADVPILIVGDDGRIRRFTRSAESLLNLLAGDVGRPISNIRPNVDVPDLDALVNQVSHNFAEQQREVRDNKGRWYSLRIRPYRTADNKIDGVLMAFFDIDELKRTNQALGETEAMVSGLVETMIRAILVINESGRIVMVNAASEAMFGYPRDLLLGQTIECLVPERLRDKHAADRAQYFQTPRIRLMGEGLSIIGRRKNGNEFPAEVSLSYIRTSKGLLGVAFVTDMTKQREVEKALAEKENALRLSEQQLQTLTGSLLTAQEEEKARLAGELHDDLNQRLAALALQAAEFEKQLADGPAGLREKVSGFRQHTEVLADDVRRLAQQLHPSILEHFGLAKALGAYCEEFAATRNLKVRYRHRDVDEKIAPEVALCLYRVAQESLTNVAKHSGAKVASVVLVGSGKDIHMTVDDDGVGFHADTTTESGLGLISMRERLRLVGGRFSIKGKPAGGTRVDVVAPLVPKPV
jgi:two-component system CheB/CheR fusion protein